MGGEGMSPYKGLASGKPRFFQEFLDGFRGKVAQVIGSVVKGIWDAKERQKVLNGCSMGVSNEHEPPGFENSITLPQKSHRIIEVLDDIKGSYSMEIVIWQLTFFECFGEDIEPQLFPGIFHPLT